MDRGRQYLSHRRLWALHGSNSGFEHTLLSVSLDVVQRDSLSKMQSKKVFQFDEAQR